jgi:hypothetical protein
MLFFSLRLLLFPNSPTVAGQKIAPLGDGAKIYL